MHNLKRSSKFKTAILKVLASKKMVFLGGPRQVGKTTFSLQLISDKKANETHPAYLNWDNPNVPARVRKMELPIDQPLLIFDEIHKDRRWRNLLKGIYDTEKSRRSILVTGSARLDHYRKGGDSLVGRYRYFRMHPLSLREISENPTNRDLERLLRWGGFPEPFLKQDESEHRIWQRDRLSRVVREDLRDLENVREIKLIEHLVAALPERVGSILSVKNLKELLEVDHKTADRWITILENLYVCYRIAPYGVPKLRTAKKEKKLYLWDWSQIENIGPRFENLVASQLLKYCHWIEDTEGHTMELRFLRDSEKREIDFVVLKNSKPLFAVECKSGENKISPHLSYFSKKTPIPKYYQVHLGQREFETGPIQVLPFLKFCKALEMP